ncbi:hypothetical protein PVAG01_01283 [Phlyctema vagabunda]|uniref:Mid2 domain-containing protein n=1 Tax=Phlyctema vagabunda TaxID=108571 RepID=A0ABR4PWP0_9HELO
MIRNTMLLRFFALGICFQLFRDVRVMAVTSSATWLFPSSDGMILNFIDTFVLQWESNYADPWMQMWCQNGTSGNNVVLGSNFQVDRSGTYPYVLKNDNPLQTDFPVACHAQLATADTGGGIDSPFGVTFISIPAIQSADAKTFSLASVSASTTTTPVTSTTSSTSASKSSIAAASSSSSSRSATTTPPSPTPAPSSSPTSSLPLNTSPALSISPENTPQPTGGLGDPGDDSEPSSQLSTTVKIGIGIGVGIVVVAVLGIAIWLIMRKRSAAKKSATEEPSIPELASNRWHGHEMDAPHGYQELDVKSHQRWVHEMPA